jgi:predicted nucleotidyltransferase
MNSKHINQVRQLLFNSHTYFETKSGLVCYTYGHYCRFDDDRMICCIVGYFSNSPTGRLQRSTNRFMEKVVYEGNEGSVNFDERFEKVPNDIKSLFHNYTKINPITKEHLLVIPFQDVLKVYSPTEVLDEIINNNSKLDHKRINAVNKILKLLIDYGIEAQNIGLYGSMQLGITHESKIIDIDILLYGLDKYNTLLKISTAQTIKPKLTSKYRSINAISAWSLARENRNRIAKLMIDSNTFADVRIVRSPSQIPSLDFQSLEVNLENKIYFGIVTDSSESLSCPSVYKIDIGGVEYLVGTRLYVFIGAAKQGDKVKIRGNKLKNKKAILIADGQRDYIKVI